MADQNLCLFVGRLGKDPEVKYFQSGDAYCNVSIAVSEKWKDKQSGESKENTTWVPLVFTGKPAEILGKYAKKGSQIRVEGKFTVRKWQKDGADQYTTEVRVRDFQLLGGKPEGAQGGQQAAPAPKPAARNSGGDMEDDIPFAPVGHGSSWAAF